LKDQIGIFHACLAQAFLGLIAFIAVVRTETWQSPAVRSATPAARRLFKLALVTTLLIYFQLGLGATMRHQHRDLAILDFPTANGAWLPDTRVPALQKINTSRDARGLSDVTAFQVWLQMAHRFGAVAVTVSVILCALRIWQNASGIVVLRKLSLLWLGLLFCQLVLGAWTIWSNKAADVATAHVAVGATMLSLGVSVCALAARLHRAPGQVGAARALAGTKAAVLA
jgi:cytochrome c oxidase assembly protein subunit 15